MIFEQVNILDLPAILIGIVRKDQRKDSDLASERINFTSLDPLD